MSADQQESLNKALFQIINEKMERKEFKNLYNLLLKVKPKKADTIVWLQGDRYDRAFKVYRLYKDEWSKKIIISGNNVLIGNKLRLGENNISLDKMKNFLLKKGVRKKDLIIDDGAMNTKEQAEHILKTAKSKKWSKIILAGSSYYQPRAFLTFLKQAKKIKWKGEIINQPATIAWAKKPAGRDKMTKFIFSQEFEKIKEYKKDLIAVEQGIKYLNKRNG